MHTYGTIEALAVIIVRQSFYPAIASLYWEAACKALGCEQLVPVSLAVWLAVLQEEWTVAEQLATVCAVEAIRMEVFADCIQTVPLQSKQRE